MIWTGEQYIDYMTFHDIGRPLFTELFGPLMPLEAEWRAQGASEDEINLSRFGFDYVKYTVVGCVTGAVTHIAPVTLSDTPEEYRGIDGMGRHVRLCKQSATIPLPMDFPVKTPDDWARIKHWYEFNEERIDKEAIRRAAELRGQGFLTVVGIPGGYDELRELMGEEALCYAVYDEPEMIDDILNTIADTSLKVFERVLDYVTIDQLSVHEDMAGKSGPLFGPEQVRRFVKPYYRRVWDELKKHGAALFCQDSDGNMKAVIDDFLDSGLNIMYPFEPAAGMDMVETRRKYGNRLGIKGGIDKHALRGSKADIRKELEYKLSDEMLHGGTVIALDHRIPNGVPIENYRYYVETVREMLGLEPADPHPFVRMAF